MSRSPTETLARGAFYGSIDSICVALLHRLRLVVPEVTHVMVSAPGCLGTRCARAGGEVSPATSGSKPEVTAAPGAPSHSTPPILIAVPRETDLKSTLGVPRARPGMRTTEHRAHTRVNFAGGARSAPWAVQPNYPYVSERPSPADPVYRTAESSHERVSRARLQDAM